MIIERPWLTSHFKTLFLRHCIQGTLDFTRPNQLKYPSRLEEGEVETNEGANSGTKLSNHRDEFGRLCWSLQTKYLLGIPRDTFQSLGSSLEIYSFLHLRSPI